MMHMIGRRSMMRAIRMMLVGDVMMMI